MPNDPNARIEQVVMEDKTNNDYYNWDVNLIAGKMARLLA
jgi:hypothetical protein